jgi:hypothetical protein
MPDHDFQARSQPFIKLVQGNLELLNRFTNSPEVSTEAATNLGKVIQQATDSMMKLLQSGAYTQVMQGMARNYTEFLTSMSQSNMAMANSGQEVLTRQVKQASEGINDAAEQQRRRDREVHHA